MRRKRDHLWRGIGKGLVVLSLLMGCVKDRHFDAPAPDCIPDLETNATYAQVRELYTDQTVQVLQDLIIEGYVVSSDMAGNFYGSLYIQNDLSRPTDGIAIQLDLFDIHLFYPPGSKVYIRLQGLYVGKSRGDIAIGGAYTSFGNTILGRMPALLATTHVIRACGTAGNPEPVPLIISEVSEGAVNTFVRLINVQFVQEIIGLPYAVETEETDRILEDCGGNILPLRNSGYADFFDTPLPEGNGSITGVLIKDNNDILLVIRDLDDVALDGGRCEVSPGQTSTSVFFSELADPDNDADARFVELYNSAAEALDLKGWKLQRYTNANTAVSSELDLSGVIPAGTAWVVSPDPDRFSQVYGRLPDLASSANGPADSNGDDNLALLDPFGVVVDMFGLIGEDGSGTTHEFEDGRALRNPGITEGNPVFDPTEWTIYNDSGGHGTINRPQTAPDDFTPGSRN